MKTVEMKMGLRQNREVDEVKLFVEKTFERCSDGNSRHLEFHKKLIAHYFGARNVKVLYEQKKVMGEIFVGSGYTTLSFGCLDLPTFFCSCIKEDQKSLQIYLDYIRNFLEETAKVENS